MMFLFNLGDFEVNEQLIFQGAHVFFSTLLEVVSLWEKPSQKLGDKRPGNGPCQVVVHL